VAVHFFGAEGPRGMPQRDPCSEGEYQLKIVWTHYSTPLGWVLLFNDDKGLKAQCCTSLLLMMSIAGLTSAKLVIDVINNIYHLFNFAIFFI
jgi:hypothetical protein